MTDTTQQTIPLTLPRVRAKVEIDGALGFLPKVKVDGERARPVRGGFPIPLAGGDTETLQMKGWIPGFQRFLWKGEEVAALGAHVGRVERIVMFAPLLLVFLASAVGIVLALILFFLSILIVKNPQMPFALRVALPIVNTVAGGVLIFALSALVAAN